MENTETTSPTRQAAVKGLAVVGFIALVVAGMSLAVYSSRYIPKVVNSIAAAAVYIGSVFTPTSPSSSGLTVVPTSSTTISFGTPAASTPAATTTNTVKPPTTTVTQTSAQTAANGSYQIGGTQTTVAPYGLPDLAVTIGAVGYLTNCGDENSFVASSTSPSSTCPAVRFTIRNIGTNWTGSWRFSATIPSFTSRPVVESDPQPSLCPPPANTTCADSVVGTVVLDRTSRSSGQDITVTANSDGTVADSNANNNSAAATLPVLGS